MLIKTEKGRHELRPGNRTLGQKERTLLLVADGQRSESELEALLQGGARPHLQYLLTQGFLERRVAVREQRSNATAPPNQHGDAFTGSRSLASARMYLFDLSERLFAPRDKALASHYRSALREARDAEGMLAVGNILIADIERLAGPERAAGIRERLDKLLPSELLEHAA